MEQQWKIKDIVLPPIKWMIKLHNNTAFNMTQCSSLLLVMKSFYCIDFHSYNFSLVKRKCQMFFVIGILLNTDKRIKRIPNTLKNWSRSIRGLIFFRSGLIKCFSPCFTFLWPPEPTSDRLCLIKITNHHWMYHPDCSNLMIYSLISKMNQPLKSKWFTATFSLSIILRC